MISMIPQFLRNRLVTFVVPYPEGFPHSNGITVLLDAALALHQAGLDVDVVPAHTNKPLYSALPSPYNHLRISWDVQPGGYVIICDTITPARLDEVRAKALRICHYLLAPPGLFGSVGPSANFSTILAGETVAVHSPQVSIEIPSFYLQTRFPALEQFIDRSVYPESGLRRRMSSRKLSACFYAGKGYLKPIPNRLRRRIDRTRSTLITRKYPSTKAELYLQLAQSDLLICYDPLTSLAFEASLLGLPVFVPVVWDEPSFQSFHPFRMDGIAWNDIEHMMTLIDCGFDQQAVLASYNAAVASSMSVLIKLLDYAFSNPERHVSSDWINAYWQQRQPFFIALGLPSPDSAWSPIEEVLQPSSIAEIWIVQFRDFFAKRLRINARRRMIVQQLRVAIFSSWLGRLAHSMWAAHRCGRDRSTWPR